jgi:hypothetical protein
VLVLPAVRELALAWVVAQVPVAVMAVDLFITPIKTRLTLQPSQARLTRRRAWVRKRPKNTVGLCWVERCGSTDDPVFLGALAPLLRLDRLAGVQGPHDTDVGEQRIGAVRYFGGASIGFDCSSGSVAIRYLET